MLLKLMTYLYVFLIGASGGWIIEVVYRRYFGMARRFMNPGFLSGPYLPIYGTGALALYIISDLNMPLVPRLLCFLVLTTGLEYITGIFFLKRYNTRLWDYSGVKMNLDGIIAPKYSLYWTLMSLAYYKILYPYFHERVMFLNTHLEYGFLVGIAGGVLIVDLINAFNIMNRLKDIMATMGELKTAILYENLKLEIRDFFSELSDKVDGHRMFPKKPSFFLPFEGDYNMRARLKAHFDGRLKDKLQEVLPKRNKS